MVGTASRLLCVIPKQYGHSNFYRHRLLRGGHRSSGKMQAVTRVSYKNDAPSVDQARRCGFFLAQPPFRRSTATIVFFRESESWRRVL